MSQVIKTIPEEVVPYLSENNRLDLIDFVSSNMKAEVRNLLDGKTELTKLTEREATLKLSEAVSMDFRLLDVSQPVDSAQQILCMIKTYGVGECESELSFFSLNWKPLRTADYISLPDELFMAEFDGQDTQTSLIVSLHHPFDQVALSEQKERPKELMKFKWSGNIFKKY